MRIEREAARAEEKKAKANVTEDFSLTRGELSLLRDAIIVYNINDGNIQQYAEQIHQEFLKGRTLNEIVEAYPKAVSRLQDLQDGDDEYGKLNSPSMSPMGMDISPYNSSPSMIGMTPTLFSPPAVAISPQMLAISPHYQYPPMSNQTNMALSPQNQLTQSQIQGQAQLQNMQSLNMNMAIPQEFNSNASILANYQNQIMNA
eukprot:TRINITY_DN3247_c1_g1_i4.p2 TRINITY_DN3247_c1_g1~~TRINITY_DN3247_c1_g1_i4.p2  ORF type:complete len:202 (+),score=56.76 TRINITY_DN3247_c1_g1_i4:483-1088(+)